MPSVARQAPQRGGQPGLSTFAIELSISQFDAPNLGQFTPSQGELPPGVKLRIHFLKSPRLKVTINKPKSPLQVLHPFPIVRHQAEPIFRRSAELSDLQTV